MRESPLPVRLQKTLPDRLIQSANRYRLPLALLVSLLAHLAVIVPWHWPFTDDSPQIRQVFLQAQLQPQTSPPTKPQPQTRHDAPAKQPATERPETEPQTEQRLTQAHSNWATPEKTATATTPPAPPAPPAPEVEARFIEQPAPPEYPAEALRLNLESCVLARVDVSAAGDVTQVAILAADIPDVFDQSVIDAQKFARYLPAQQDGKTVASSVLAVSAFVLTADKRLNCALKYADTARRLIQGQTAP